MSLIGSCVSPTGAIDEYDYLYNILHMKKVKWLTDNRETRDLNYGSSLAIRKKFPDFTGKILKVTQAF